VTDPQAMAEALIAARRERRPIAPFTRRNPFLQVETAYKAQALVVEDLLATGEHVVGAKLGLTSRVKRAALGIHEPVYGRLTSGMVLPSGEPLTLDGLIHPRAEPEIAFLVGRAIRAPTTVTQVLAATEAIFPALEVVDSHYATSFRLPDSVADNAGAAHLVIGNGARRPGELVDLSVLGCVFRCRGGIDTAAGGAVLGHPARALVWLAEALATRGEAIEAGWIVLTGGLTASVALQPQGVVTAEFDGLGSVGLQCT
jgi:2-oxo-3-hexenedioate decarboxylase